MRRRIAASWIGLALLAAGAVSAETGEEDARLAAESFGRALIAERASDLRAILPEHGRVRLRLVHMGPENGFFGARQVEAVFRDYFAKGSIRSFAITHVESDGRSYSLADGLAELTDRQGRRARSAVHLAFQPEDGRWVLREIKEVVE